MNAVPLEPLTDGPLEPETDWPAWRLEELARKHPIELDEPLSIWEDEDEFDCD